MFDVECSMLDVRIHSLLPAVLSAVLSAVAFGEGGSLGEGGRRIREGGWFAPFDAKMMKAKKVCSLIGKIVLGE